MGSRLERANILSALTLQADYYQVNSFNPAYPSGDFQFSADITSLPGIIDTGDPFASFLLGLPAYAERTITTSPSYFRDSYQSLAGSDKYELSKNLTISAQSQSQPPYAAGGEVQSPEHG